MDIEQKIKEILVQSLNVEEEEIKPNSSLSSDLNAESIDLLDITFRIEREFDLRKVDTSDLFPTDIFKDVNDCIDDKNRVTPKGIALLKEKIPFGYFEEWEKDPLAANIGNVFTVGTLISYVKSKLEG